MTSRDASHVGTGPSTGGFRLLVCGGPEFNDRQRVWQAMDAANARRAIGTLLQGSDAIAVQLAGLWCAEHRVVRETFGRYWPSVDKKSGLLLPRKMENVHGVLVFPGADGSGWPEMALQAHVPVWAPFS